MSAETSDECQVASDRGCKQTGSRMPFRRLRPYCFAGACLLAMLPAADEHNKPLAVIKIVGLTAILIGVGWAVFTSSRRGVAGDPA